VSKGAVLTILALMDVLRELCAELGLILLHMIESFNSIMSLGTAVFLLTFVSFAVIAKFRRVLSVLPPLVLYRMEIATVLVVVLALHGARLVLEFLKVQVFNDLVTGRQRVNNVENLIVLNVLLRSGFSTRDTIVLVMIFLIIVVIY
jgi:hypothetical protein